MKFRVYYDSSIYLYQQYYVLDCVNTDSAICKSYPNNFLLAFKVDDKIVTFSGSALDKFSL